MEKKKKLLIIGGIVEALILIAALIISIIVWTTSHTVDEATAAGKILQDYNVELNGPFIAFFQNNTVAFFLIVCVPIFVIVALDLVYLAVVASKRESNLSDEQLKAIKKKAEEEVRAEIMKEILENEKKESE